MWLAFGGLSTNKTPAINGDENFTLPPPAGLSLHSHTNGHTPGRPTASPHKGSSGSSRNLIVVHVALSARSPDPFLSSAAEWPANSTDWDVVFQVSESFNTPDIPFWTPLTKLEERWQVFRDNKSRCLNCHCTDHSFRNCAKLLGGGPPANSLTVFQPSKASAPPSGTHAPGMSYGPTPNTNLNGSQLGTFRTN